ncbi:MAG: UDP-3-O-(3-hydroxymyristoyl)glucosamine N-acyltransferase [Planctomycetaceae bacterium]|jgi:UDP-3-O-[3-hydroxymyristoyl] glucosamine N-acyltransferase|nr:UDP-3-O-(3-hydroxymyristoyl)glucosamine N-acyltransferase [Planctomycetaceae bacterium]
MLLSEIAALIGGTVIGDGNYNITGVAPLQNAEPQDITFLERADRIAVLLRKSKAGAVIVPPGIKPEGFNAVQAEHVVEAFETVVRHFKPPCSDTVEGISERAAVHSSVKLGSGVAVGHFAVIAQGCEIGNNVIIHGGVQIAAECKIGDNTVVFPNVVLYRSTVIGKNCIIHGNTTIGAFGFGYDSSSGQHKLSPQLGSVVIGNDVEIGANSAIDRATYGSTVIGDGTKIDNLVHIAHNCKLGRHNLICAHTGIAGSATTGNNVVMAGRVGVKDHVHIGDRAVLGAMAGIIADVEADARIVGIPATPEREQMRIQIALQALPAMRKEFKMLQKTVAALQK